MSDTHIVSHTYKIQKTQTHIVNAHVLLILPQIQYRTNRKRSNRLTFIVYELGHALKTKAQYNKRAYLKRITLRILTFPNRCSYSPMFTNWKKKSLELSMKTDKSRKFEEFFFSKSRHTKLYYLLKFVSHLWAFFHIFKQYCIIKQSLTKKTTSLGRLAQFSSKMVIKTLREFQPENFSFTFFEPKLHTRVFG